VFVLVSNHSCWVAGQGFRTLEGISRRIYSPLPFDSGRPRPPKICLRSAITAGARVNDRGQVWRLWAV
jgi:hypothetical protein